MMVNRARLYNQDFNLWLEQTAIAIKNQDVANMDWEGLLETIEDMGASEKRALRSYVKRLIEHILKLKYWESERQYNQKHWEKEIVNFREEIKDILKDSPSLNSYLEENYQDWFRKSVKAIAKEFDLPNDIFEPLATILQDD
jgi:hypothetical protein